MSKVRMKRIFICGSKSNRKPVLELLQHTGIVQVETGDIADDSLPVMDVSSERAGFMKASQQVEQALEVLETYAPSGAGLLASLEGAKAIDRASYAEQAAKALDYVGTAREILGISRQIAEDKASIPKCENRLDTLSAWEKLDLPLNFSGTRSSRAFIGSVSGEMEMDQLSTLVGTAFGENDAPDFIIELISSQRNMTSFMVVCHADDAQAVDNALREIGFAKAPESAMVPSEEISELKEQIEGYRLDMEKCGSDIAAYASEREHLKFAADYYRMRADKYELLGSIPQSENVFFISGYTPAKTAERLVKKLEALEAYAEISDPDPDEDVPCQLSNVRLAEPVESVVDAYAYPGIHEIDPSAITACFYYIMFGMMLSDAGYGLMLVLGCGFVLLKVKNMQPGMKKMLSLMFLCGIPTTFWGFMFGSFFGDAVNSIATTFFNRPDISLDPLWFNPQSEPMRLLVVAFAIGIVHLFTGLAIKLYELIKQGQIKDAIYDVVFWYMFIGGAIVYMLTMDMIKDMFSISIELGPTVAFVSKWVLILGVIGVVLTGGRESKNWGVRIASGLYSAYGCTSWLSDVLSYSRLLALGLATGVIAQVFNKMGSMAAAAVPLPIGIILFAVIFVFAHMLNLAINLLGAYVHTNRLQFVEFFGKFYEGSGRKFEPFAEKTKYYSVKEDI